MKVTFDLAPELVKAIKIRAIEENRKLKDMVADLLRRGLAQPEPPPSGRGPSRVELPLVHTAHPARPDEEMTPERAATVLLGEETSAVDR